MKILAFAASNSKKSINKQLVIYASSFITRADVEILDLNDYELPLFSVDREAEQGEPPALAQKFFDKIGEANGILISFAEHNGSYSAAYKNLYDWTSRIDQKVYQGKPMVLLATSPGPGGAKNVLGQAKTSMPHFGGVVVADLSIPLFYEAFDAETKSLLNTDLRVKLERAVGKLSL